MPRHNLGELEQLVLLALLRLDKDAYGVTIRREILERTGRSITPGAIYPTLDRLEARGLVSSWMGEPTAERGGRSRRYFAVTKAGLSEIRRSWNHAFAMAEGLERALNPKTR
jgi:DNA-binding PadR family transcriptional regulator